MSIFILVSVLLIKWKETSIMSMIIKEKNLFNNYLESSPRFINVNEKGGRRKTCVSTCVSVCVQVCAFILACVHVHVCACECSCVL